MKKRNRTEETSRASQDALTDVMSNGVQKLIAQALNAEVTESLAKFARE